MFSLLLAASLVGDAMPQPLTDQPGDAQRGRAIVVSRQRGLCLLCHGGSFPEERTPGTLASSLDGVGSRWSAAQLRARIVDARALDPETLMPSFHRPSSAARVPARLQGQPLLSAQEVEDVVAFLQSLR